VLKSADLSRKAAGPLRDLGADCSWQFHQSGPQQGHGLGAFPLTTGQIKWKRPPLGLDHLQGAGDALHVAHIQPPLINPKNPKLSRAKIKQAHRRYSQMQLRFAASRRASSRAASCSGLIGTESTWWQSEWPVRASSLRQEAVATDPAPPPY